jgi:hypothetical protein
VCKHREQHLDHDAADHNAQHPLHMRVCESAGRLGLGAHVRNVTRRRGKVVHRPSSMVRSPWSVSPWSVVRGPRSMVREGASTGLGRLREHSCRLTEQSCRLPTWSGDRYERTCNGNGRRWTRNGRFGARPGVLPFQSSRSPSTLGRAL